MTKLRIIGAGGHGKVVADAAEACGYRPIEFLDRDWPARDWNGRWPIVGKPEHTENIPVFCAIGNNAVRSRMLESHQLLGSPVLVHPGATVSPSVHLGPGCFVAAGAVINADAEIGAGVILNTGCSVDHDCIVGDFAHVSPGARLAGGVTVGPRSWIGMGAAIRENIAIGEDVLVAAGAVVVRNITGGTRVRGVPAQAF